MKREFLACILLMIGFYVSFKIVQFLLLEHEQAGFLQLARLMLVAKYNYFNMSFGALFGVMSGIYLQKHYREDYTLKSLVAGIVAVVTGLVVLYVTAGVLDGFYEPDDMGVWRWSFYSGLVLIITAFISYTLDRYPVFPKTLKELLHVIGVIGQCTFPLFVFHGLVIPGKDILENAGIPGMLAFVFSVSLFIIFSVWMVYKLYKMYYGKLS
jgi:hypothetical protein